MVPTTAIRRFDLSLSYGEFALMANQRKFGGIRVLPPAPVNVQSADFVKVKTEHLLGPVENIVRAPKATYKGDDTEFAVDSYATQDHGVFEILDDRSMKMYGEVNSEQLHRDRAINRVLQAYEAEVSEAVFNTTTWTGGLATGAGTAWTTPATADPIANIDTAMDAVHGRIGLRPNTLVITEYAYRKGARTERIEALVKYSGTDDPKTLAFGRVIADICGIETIIIVDGWKNTKSPSQSPTLARLWDPTMAMVCHVSRTMDLEDGMPTIGRTIMWTDENASIPGSDDPVPGVIIEEYRDEDVRGSKLRARADWQVKILHPEAGQLITGVTA